jgi:hypothetical protein
VLQYSNDGWGPDNIDRVFVHETGHIFNAPDEYADSHCDCGGSWGYFHLPNLNCENCAPGGSVSCIMSHNDWQMCACTPRRIGAPQWNIGCNTTADTPFAADGVCYFRGTDDKLWRVDAQTGQNQQWINKNTAKSARFMADGVVYCQGTDDKVWRVNIDGTNQQQINRNTTASSKFVANGVVYFRGTDDKFWRVNVDGSGQYQLGANSLFSSPFVASGTVYFRGTDNKLWLISVAESAAQAPAEISLAHACA